ncbi:hypothetical protein BD324DRAFT_680710 [Kockovaella imperatae]|uniref:Actin-like ATPase domain-containing protein n=1 Tax=Kockovaella imperatae TaxID=4999 RepID=A0A1Y1UIK5_9TREE|nr:hypothetical protein BD324DRAFT_680710 [Kockovaella imperatae]ORX37832.1 hypothetical protein BD324DRAFT_680710 [Kockovaella imperatae]
MGNCTSSVEEDGSPSPYTQDPRKQPQWFQQQQMQNQQAPPPPFPAQTQTFQTQPAFQAQGRPQGVPPASNNPYTNPSAWSEKEPIQDQGSGEAIAGNAPIARKTGEVLVISYDIGTTASGCAYMYRDSSGEIGFGPEVVDQWPGQTATSLGKTPSILFYDQGGHCRPEWGAECLAPKWTPGRLSSLGIHKTEWFKLHVDPASGPTLRNGPEYQLPPRVSVYQVYTDYMTRLHSAAIARLKSRRGADLFDRLSAEGRVQYILTIPAAWQKPSIVGELRRCALRAGLITTEDSTALDFCAEPEASALECVGTFLASTFNAAKQLVLTSNDIFTVVDAGGGTVDLTSYQVLTPNPYLTLKEIDIHSTRCLYEGGTFVDASFELFLRDKLCREYPAIYQERHVARGVKEFASSIKIQFGSRGHSSTFLTLSDEDEYDQGCIELHWHEIEQCFKPQVDKIVSAVRGQVTSHLGQSKVIFCSGGFGSNDYLRDRLASEFPGIQVLQPGDKSAGSKAVCLGATRYGIFRSVKSRTCSSWYGVQTFRDYKSSDQNLDGALAHTGVGKRGQKILNRVFSPMLSPGESIEDDEWRSAPFTMHLADNASAVRKGYLVFFQSDRFAKPTFTDEIGSTQLCRVDVFIPPHVAGKPIIAANGDRFRSYDIIVWLSLGRADLRTRVSVDNVESGGGTVSWQQ